MKSPVLPPLIATLHVRPASWRFGLRLWVPLFLLWLLLLPLVILALPVLCIACLVFSMSARKLLQAMSAIFAALAAIRGTRVEVDDGRTHLFIQVH